MRILILYEERSTEQGIQIRQTVKQLLENKGFDVDTLLLRREQLKPCVGCVSCWLKTPGSCIITDDDANKIASLKMQADAVVLVSEIVYGGFSADIKAYLDRSIQNIMPYFKNYRGEMHHPKRYKRFPIWLAIGYGAKSEGEKVTFIKLTERNALNMHPDRYLGLAIDNEEELMQKVDNILDILEVRA